MKNVRCYSSLVMVRGAIGIRVSTMQKSSLRMSLNLILTKPGWLVLSTTYLCVVPTGQILRIYVCNHTQRSRAISN